MINEEEEDNRGSSPAQQANNSGFEKKLAAYLEPFKKDLTDQMSTKFQELEAKFKGEIEKLSNLIENEFGFNDEEEPLLEEEDDSYSGRSLRPQKKNVSLLDTQALGSLDEDKEGG